MKSPSLVRMGVLVLALIGFTTGAQAAPITYEISGIASGMIGGSPFIDALVTVLVTGDTTNVVTEDFGGSFCCAFVNVGATTVTIAGIGTATVTGSEEAGVSPNPTAIYSFPDPISVGPGFPALPTVIIGTLDSPPATDSFTGLAFAASMALLGYDLQTSIGPIPAIPGGVAYPERLFVHTTLGNLSFTSDIEPTTEGTFVATVAAVPEPVSLTLLAIGAAGLLTHRCRRRRLS
jgi:hypothetical protein